MKKIKSIITGVLSGVVLFMAVQIGAAQEKVASFMEKVTAMESIGAKALAATAQNLNTEWVQNKVQIEVMKEPVVKNGISALDNVWYKYTGPTSMPAYDPNNASFYTKLEESEEPECTSGSIVCAVNLPDNEEEDHPRDDDLDGIQSEISSPNPNQNIVRKFTP